jgi:3-methyladenine DNA glycosylase AlkD
MGRWPGARAVLLQSFTHGATTATGSPSEGRLGTVSVEGPIGAAVDEAVEQIVSALRAAGRPERAEGEKAYLKSDLEFWGVGVPGTRAVVRAVLPKRPAPAHDLVVAVAEALWAEPVHERRLAACELLVLHVARLGPADLVVVERLLREARTWALVDLLAPDVAGPIVVAHPHAGGAVLDRWNGDDDFWLRRASVLALLRPLRAGGGDWERFARYADVLWEEKEFFVRKALGWILRDTGRRRPELVFEFLLPRAATASGVTVREAIKPLNDEQRAAVLAARSAG